jgi:hypothetical protein
VRDHTPWWSMEGRCDVDVALRDESIGMIDGNSGFAVAYDHSDEAVGARGFEVVFVCVAKFDVPGRQVRKGRRNRRKQECGSIGLTEQRSWRLDCKDEMDGDWARLICSTFILNHSIKAVRLR